MKLFLIATFKQRVVVNCREREREGSVNSAVLGANKKTEKGGFVFGRGGDGEMWGRGGGER